MCSFTFRSAVCPVMALYMAGKENVLAAMEGEEKCK